MVPVSPTALQKVSEAQLTARRMFPWGKGFCQNQSSTVVVAVGASSRGAAGSGAWAYPLERKESVKPRRITHKLRRIKPDKVEKKVGEVKNDIALLRKKENYICLCLYISAIVANPQFFLRCECRLVAIRNQGQVSLGY